MGRDIACGPIQVASPVSEPLERFIRERLPSTEQVEIVLLLRAERERPWSAPEVSQNLGTPPESTAMRLFLLASNGIIVFDGGAGIPRYRYSMADPDADALLAELVDLYQTNRDAVHEITGVPVRDPLRSFADAFKLKK